MCWTGLAIEREASKERAAFPTPFQESIALPQVLEYQRERHGLFSSEAEGRTDRSTRNRSPSSLEGKERKPRRSKLGRRLTYFREGNPEGKYYVQGQIETAELPQVGGPDKVTRETKRKDKQRTRGKNVKGQGLHLPTV